MFLCSNCGKAYKTDGVWLKKHRQMCFSSSHNNRIGDIYPFSDDFFIENGSFMQPSEDIAWIKDLKPFNDQKLRKLTLIHLNINSLFSKFHHVYEILSSINPDILCLNETKLDPSVPDAAISFNGYNIHRRDRCGNGGGVLIYLKKQYRVLNSFISLDFELIHLKLSFKKNVLNLLSAYKPPSEQDQPFIDYLETRLANFSPNDHLVIVGDLNMNWFNDKGSTLKEFCLRNTLANAVISPTRMVEL